MAQFYEPGTYRAEIVRQVFDDGKHGLQLILTILPKAFVDSAGHAQAVEKEYERDVYLTFMDEAGNEAVSGSGHNLSEKAVEVVAHLGVLGGKLTTLNPDHPNHHSFVGQAVEAFCNHYTNKEGEQKASWHINTPRPVRDTTPASSDRMRKLDAMFNKQLKDMGGVKAAKPKPAPQKSAGIPVDEKPPEGIDIPF